MLALLLLLAQAQSVAPPQRPPAVRALVDQAQALPPEFSADVLLKLAGSKLIPEIKWKRELIEDAFTLGAHAQLPYLQHGDANTDSRPSVAVAGHGLEALTLQTRAVDAMMTFDGPRALAMFRDIPMPDFPAVPCQDIIRADPSAYYSEAAKLFHGAFRPQERKEEEDVRFVEQRVRSLRSPVEVVPALQMMTEVLPKVTPAQRAQLVGAFASTLDQVNGSDRLFSGTEILLVGAALPLMHDSQLFLPSLRNYIVRHVRAARCTENFKPEKLPEAVQQYNRLLPRLDPTTAQQRLISNEEAQPAKDDGRYEKHLFWESARSKQVLDALRWLNHGNRDLPGDQRFWTPAERATPEWNARYLDTLKLMEGWKEDEEGSPEDYSFMVSAVYGQLAALVPPGKPRENAIDTYLQFLEQQYYTLANHNLWFSEVEVLLRTAHSGKDPQDKAWLFNRMMRSSNPVIALYSRLETLL